MENVYYVYEWYNIKDNSVFYVGKGTKKRFMSLNHRNELFLDYIKNNETSSRIIKEFNNEQEAFDYENKMIEYYQNIGQCNCNICKGGYGGFSQCWTEEFKKYWSENNPMKREEQRKRMSLNNPMKNKETVEKVSKHNRRPVIINNIEYPSVKEASEKLGVCQQTITLWCQQGYTTLRQSSARYKDEPQKNYDKINPLGKAVYIDDKYFLTLKEASQYLGCKTSNGLCKNLKLGKPTYKGHTIRYANQQPSQGMSNEYLEGSTTNCVTDDTI